METVVIDLTGSDDDEPVAVRVAAAVKQEAPENDKVARMDRYARHVACGACASTDPGRDDPDERRNWYLDYLDKKRRRERAPQSRAPSGASRCYLDRKKGEK